MLYYIRKQEVGKTPKQELAKKGLNMNTIYTIERNGLTIAIFTDKQSAQHSLETIHIYGSKNVCYTLKAWHSDIATYTDCEALETFVK